MTSTRRPWHRPFRVRLATRIAVALGLFALLVAACGDDTADAGTRTLAESTARVLAGDALLRETELPEARWRIVPEGTIDATDDDFAPNDLFDSPACAVLDQFFQPSEAVAAGQPAPIARAERTFEATDGAFTLHVVHSAIAVYETQADAGEASRLAAEALTADALRDCLGEGLVGFEQDGVEITRVDLSGPGAAVDGSTGITLDVEVFAVFFTMDLQMHIYTFQRDHAVASLVTLELNPGLLEREQQALLEAFAGRVSRAHEGM